MLVLLQALGRERDRGRLSINLLLCCSAMMADFGATMTLPGIAGFILTIGMGVDSNVLIFERIKEEIASRGKSPKAGVASGFDRVFLTYPRHPRRVAHRGGIPVQLRHRPHQGLRGDAHDWPAHQRVHVGVRLACTLRARALSTQGCRRSASGRARGPSCRFSRTPSTTSSGGGGTPSSSRLSSSSAAPRLMLARGGMPLGIDFTGGTLVVVKFDQRVTEDAVRKGSTRCRARRPCSRTAIPLGTKS